MSKRLSDLLQKDPTATFIPADYITIVLVPDTVTGGLRPRNSRGDFLLSQEAKHLFALMQRFYAIHDDDKLRLANFARGTDNEQLKPGIVYLIQRGQYFKIGFTHNLPERLKTLRWKSPIRIKLIYYVFADDPLRLEAGYHSYFADKRGQGEWFKLTEADVENFAQLAKGYGFCVRAGATA